MNGYCTRKDSVSAGNQTHEGSPVVSCIVVDVSEASATAAVAFTLGDDGMVIGLLCLGSPSR